jgi:uncharacterized membrane-anchored protein
MPNGTIGRDGGMNFARILGCWFFAVFALMLSGRARAEDGNVAAPAQSPETEAAPALPPEWEKGPKHVALGHELSLELPGNHAFLPPAPAAKVLEKNGSFHNEDLLGLIASTDPSEEWFVVARFEESGFIKDDEKVDADEILGALRDGTKEANEERTRRGFKPLTIDGWSEPPRYESAQHHLVWALIVSDPDGKSVNLNTRILGRKGYVSLNLVTDPQKLAGYRGQAAALLSATHFDSGARYEDFNEKTDKVAEYGLAGLVLAGAGLGAAKLVKLGLLAKFSKVIIGLLIAGKKLVVVALLAIGAFLKKILGGRRPSGEGEGEGEGPAT